MADGPQQKPQRSLADKEKSRQQSRSVSGKDAAAGSSGSSRQRRSSPKGGGGASQGKGAGGKAPGRSPRPGSQGQRGARPASRPAPGPRRSPTALLTWGLVGLVIVIVIVLVVVKLTGSSTTTSSAPPAGPVPATVLQEVTHVPASVYDTVGVTSPTVTVTPPKIQKNQPALTFGGKPGIFYMGGEFCPYCAAERWAVVTSLARFGKLTGLQTMQSSGTDVYPNTQTFSFNHATFTSPYLSAKLVEVYSNQKNSAGTGYKILHRLTKSEQALVTKYDHSTSSTSSGSIPFVDVGNKFISSGASYSPSILAGLTRSQIAAGLSDPKNPVTRAIISMANYYSASFCSLTGGQPTSVCTTKGVTAASKALGLSS